MTVCPSAKAASVSDPPQTVDDLYAASTAGRCAAAPPNASVATALSGCWQRWVRLVYLSYDDQFQRLFAIKAPHAKLVELTADAEAYLVEARTFANLDHANIVTVYDVRFHDLFPCFIDSKFIDGTNLFPMLRQSRVSIHEAVELTATVALALNYAHVQGIVHRDVKPGNILLYKSGKAYIADFGLALRKQDVGTGPRYAGTPSYMSPEQAG